MAGATFAVIADGDKKRWSAENLTGRGREWRRFSTSPDQVVVTWRYERDPAKPVAPRPDRRRGRLEGSDGPVSSPDHRLAQSTGRAGGRPGGPQSGRPPELGQAPAQLPAL